MVPTYRFLPADYCYYSLLFTEDYHYFSSINLHYYLETTKMSALLFTTTRCLESELPTTSPHVKLETIDGIVLSLANHWHEGLELVC